MHCEYARAAADREPPEIDTRSPVDDGHTSNAQNVSSSRYGESAYTTQRPVDDDATQVELRLLHYFMGKVIESYPDEMGFWRLRIPLIAFEHRHVFDALLSMSALFLYRHTSDESLAGNERRPLHERAADQSDHSVFLAGKTPQDIRRISDYYFQMAIQKQGGAIKELNKANFEAAYTVSVIISQTALFLLGCSQPQDGEWSIGPLDETLWFRLSIGPVEVIRAWNTSTGQDVLQELGILNMKPNFRDTEELFHPDNGKPFEVLLTWAREFENINLEEQTAYQQALSYIGLMYIQFRDQLEPPLITSRRILAVPSRLGNPFMNMVLEGRPRALVILAHVIAMMRLIEADVRWYKDIAQRRLPAIHGRLAPGWKKVLRWPLAILEREVGSKEPLPIPPTAEELS